MIEFYGKTRILVVDDDKRLCDMIKRYLEEQTSFTVSTVYSGEDALKEIKNLEPELVILDLMLPGKDGIEICREIVNMTDIPIIMLTAKGNPTDKVIGLEVGSDDYIAKPFEPRELLARCKAVLRRKNKQNNHKKTKIIKFDDIEINFEDRSVNIKGDNVQFTAHQFDIIKILARKAGEIVSREYILDKMLGKQFEIFDRSIDVHIANIRKILAVYGHKNTIVTIRSAGYMFKKLSQTNSKI